MECSRDISDPLDVYTSAQIKKTRALNITINSRNEISKKFFFFFFLSSADDMFCMKKLMKYIVPY